MSESPIDAYLKSYDKAKDVAHEVDDLISRIVEDSNKLTNWRNLCIVLNSNQVSPRPVEETVFAKNWPDMNSIHEAIQRGRDAFADNHQKWNSVPIEQRKHLPPPLQ
jgi:hypothetical protein